jgi:hypothetical protein
MPGKRLQLDDETWTALRLLASDGRIGSFRIRALNQLLMSPNRTFRVGDQLPNAVTLATLSTVGAVPLTALALAGYPLQRRLIKSAWKSAEPLLNAAMAVERLEP